ncbi:hypothetical protein RSOLAG22IIIB_06674 [Rhizoctonia solani]|uniref:Transmembrane protein n=1 Tax=Rhizoctonia solani TaxID=456999 RepID=A0A0K6GG50_9AGAM|nr:hypothetical protein RSOLAG22IIIB_06674 [Rhizoctonia solani]
MLAFSRIASFVLFVLSLSFLTYAAPTPISNELSVRGEGAGEAGILVAACVDLRAKLYLNADIVAKLDDVAQVKAVVDVMVRDLKVYADLVLKVKGIKVDAALQAEIAAHLLVILNTIVRTCATIIAKFGVSVCLDIIATLQVALKLVIDNLNICIVGFIDVFVKLIADAQLKAIADVRLDVLLKLFLSVRARLGLNVNLGLGALADVSL